MKSCRGVGWLLLLHLLKNAVEQFEQHLLDRLAIGGDARQHLDVAIELEGDPQVLNRPGIISILFVGGHDVWRRCISPERLQNALGLPESLRPCAVHDDDEPEHALRENLPHEVEALLAGGAEEVQDEIVVDSNSAEIHSDRRRFLDAFGLRADLALSRNDVDLADRLDEGRLSSVERTCDYHLDGLHAPSPLTRNGSG